MRTGLKISGCWMLVLFLIIMTSASASAQPPAFSKAFSPDTIGPGSVSTLTFTITNGSATNVTDMDFTDNLPAGVTIAAPTNASSDCLGPIGVLSAPAGGAVISLEDGRMLSFSACTVSVDVVGGAAGVHTNLSGDLTSSLGNSGTAAEVLIVDNNRPGFTKAFSPNPAASGVRSTLTFTIDNAANSGFVGGFYFTDTLPVGMVVTDPVNSSTDCPVGNFTAAPGTDAIAFSASYILSGETCDASIDVVAVGSGLVGNSSGQLTSSAGYNGKANATLDVTRTTLGLTKAFTDDPAPAGGEATLEFTITNYDRFDPITNITFTDDLGAALGGLAATALPADGFCGAGSSLTGTTTLTLTGASLAAEASCTFSATLTVPAGAAPGGYTNVTGAILGTLSGGPTMGNSASDILFVQPVPILTKEFTDDPVIPGGDVTLEFTITNPSTTDGAVDISFLDDLNECLTGLVASGLPAADVCGGGSTLTEDGEIQLSGGNLGPGAECTFSVTLNVPGAAVPGPHLNTTSDITATVDGTSYTGSPASDSLQIATAPTMVKSFTNDPVTAGDDVTLEFTISHHINNSGGATGISFTDDLTAVMADLVSTSPTQTGICGPGSEISGTSTLTFTGGILSPGDDCTFSVTLQTPGGASPGNHTNITSDVTADVSGLAPTSSGASDDLIIASLAFTKEFIDDTMIPGDTATLRFTIENTSASQTATNIAFTDNLDDMISGLVATSWPSTPCNGGSSITGTDLLTFTGGELTTGQSCQFDVDVLVPGATADGAYFNHTSALDADIDGNPIVLSPASDQLMVQTDWLELTKSFTDDPTPPGEDATLEFTLVNSHPTGDASAIAFTDDLDAALTGLSAVPPLPVNPCGGTISGAGVLDFSGGVLAAGASCSFEVTVRTPSGALTTATNTTSSVTGTINGLPVTGLPASDDLDIGYVGLTKAFNGETVPGGDSTLTFTLTNRRQSQGVANINFADSLGNALPGLQAVDLPASVCGGVITGTDLLTFTGGELAADDSCSFDVQLQVPSNAPGGSHLNETSPVFSEATWVGSPASASLTVHALFDDGDGVPFVEESGPDGATFDYDGNGDFIPDNIQGNVASFHTEDGANYVTLAAESGLQLENVTAVPNPSPGNAPALQFPYGFFEFTITGLSAGQTTTLNLILPDGAYAKTYWKYGPIPGPSGSRWYEFMFSNGTGATITANLISMVFVDGQRGDDDLTADGVIIDQGGPGQDPDVPAPTLSEWGMILLSTLLMAVACLAIRRKKLAPAPPRRGRRGR